MVLILVHRCFSQGYPTRQNAYIPTYEYFMYSQYTVICTLGAISVNCTSIFPIGKCVPILYTSCMNSKELNNSPLLTMTHHGEIGYSMLCSDITSMQCGVFLELGGGSASDSTVQSPPLWKQEEEEECTVVAPMLAMVYWHHQKPTQNASGGHGS